MSEARRQRRAAKSVERRKVRAVRDSLSVAMRAHPCGDCTVCCIVLEVGELKKKGGLPCPRLSLEGKPGCSRYDERPQSCKGYDCVWRAGLIPGGLSARPDKLGILFDIGGPEGVPPMLVAREVRRGAFEDGMQVLNTLAGQGQVVYLIDQVLDPATGVARERRRFIGPEERVKAIVNNPKRRLPVVTH